MQMKKYAATAALSIAAMGVAAGTVHADPVATDAPAPISYKATTTDTSLTYSVDGGTLDVNDGRLEVKNSQGTVVAGTPLTVQVDDVAFPIDAQVDGNTAVLTPQIDLDHASLAADVDLPFQDQAPWKTPYDREVAAFTRFKDTIGTGATIGTALGGLTGAAIGCAAGAAGGATGGGILGFISGSGVATAPGAAAGGLGGCLVGAAATGFIGTFLGQIVVTLPVIIGATIQYVTTITEPFNPPAPAK
ncbi:hypothetical protein [Nocardia stercoris]|uniref:DUF8020 domain-containing protein n=1 Tax=Nocardia stercoris TaxID=2483361 RepID=A0A3M2LI43_9NOCA|nr:hypothetical protein [Nocardia stercoris]RMI34448.1 hypothetical protein EBN03_07440 [Nocardia stercoris]